MSYTQIDAPGTMPGKKNVGEAERVISVAGGALMMLSGLWGIRKSPFSSMASAAAGAYLLYRGATGSCLINRALDRNTAGKAWVKKHLEISETIIVNRSRGVVYAYWRRLENLPKFMHHLKSVKEYDLFNSHWEARIPGGIGTLEWDARIIHELENESLAWRSVEDALVDNAGEVRFHDAPGQGTVVTVKISYRPPAGELGMAVSAMFNDMFEQLIREDLHRFKDMLESGDIGQEI